MCRDCVLTEHDVIIYYVLTDSEVFTRISQSKILPSARQGRGLNIAIRTERSRLVSYSLYGFLLCFCMPVIGPLVFRETNALQFVNQSARYIGYKTKPYIIRSNIVGVTLDIKRIMFALIEGILTVDFKDYHQLTCYFHLEICHFLCYEVQNAFSKSPV